MLLVSSMDKYKLNIHTSRNTLEMHSVVALNLVRWNIMNIYQSNTITTCIWPVALAIMREVFPAVRVTVYSSATSEFKFTEKQTLWQEATPTQISVPVCAARGISCHWQIPWPMCLLRFTHISDRSSCDSFLGNEIMHKEACRTPNG